MQNEVKVQIIGDEYFLSLAATEMENIRNAAPYMERTWTRGGAYFASTRYSDSQCILLHCISEKAYGLNYLYLYYNKKNKFPPLQKIASILNLPQVKGKKINRYTIYVLIQSLWSHILKLLFKNRLTKNLE